MCHVSCEITAWFWDRYLPTSVVVGSLSLIDINRPVVIGIQPIERRTRAEEWAGIPLLRRLADDTEANIDDFSDEICQAITQHLLHLARYPADFPRVFDREALIDTASPAERTRVLLTRMADDLAWMADLAARSRRPPRP